MKTPTRSQAGASLIEVLVSMLILSFGMLALSGMLAYSVQMPRLSSYRSTAVMLAAAHIERMRANPTAFVNDRYVEDPATYAQGPGIAPGACTYPCSDQTIANLDKFHINEILRQELPKGGMLLKCNVSCASREGDLWIMWQEPTTFAALEGASSDQCPPASGDMLTYPPRCIHMRFKL